ncbi:hypothetical protein HPB50_020074 [Hyalomma asiaticum]|uniref:Uncharacterized protein n=1 Tax=Hyalomma asiaticum TaxID=266040 RepID=A0ACB7S8B4_HYAAI|nr:hypothetical protein HPB50_020074 [Hyalomma asiaticum]
MLYKSCIAVLTTPTGELDAVKSTLRAAGVMWPHRPPPAERRDLLRMMFHCDYALGWSAVFRVDPWLYQNSTKAYVLTDSGFNFIVRNTFVDLLARHGELDMYAYASWCTVQVAALFANGELILNYYGHPQRALILHGAFCLSRAYIAAGKVLLRNYAREVLPLMARSGAETIALNVQTAFLERLSSWADYNFNASPLWSWDNTSMSFSVFDPVPKVNYTDVVVGEMGESFLQNWRNAWMSRTHYRAIDIKIAITAIETLAFSADIEYRKGFILLPYVFSFPYYDMNAMPSINYGGFGAQVAFAVGQRFHSTYLSEDTGGVSFNTFLSCISNVSLTAERKDAASLFAEVVSLGALVDAYRNVSDGRRLIFLERLTGVQLLFIAICYAKCIGSYYVVDDTMCNLVLQNVPEFSDAFGCAPGTPMNPRQQCRLFDRSFTARATSYKEEEPRAEKTDAAGIAARHPAFSSSDRKRPAYPQLNSDPTAPGHEAPTHGVAHPQTIPRKDSDQLRKLGARRGSERHSHTAATYGRRPSNEPQQPAGVPRRESGESNMPGVRKKASHRRHSQPQHSRSMLTLRDSLSRASGAGSHMRYSSAATFSGMESGRRTSLPPAVIAAAAAALRVPLSARRASQWSRLSTIMRHPLTALFYIVVPALCLTVCLGVLFTLLSSLLDRGDASQPATCTTHACREYALRLTASLNWSVDPCHSFTRFVCDGWRQRQLFGVHEESFGAASDRITRIVRTITVPPTGQDWLQRAAKLYRTCIGLLATGTCELDAVKAALRAAGVMWPHPPPRAERRDLIRMMFHCDYTLGWSALFRVDPKLYQNSTKAYVLTDSGFNVILRKYQERSTVAQHVHYFNRLRNAFRDKDANGAADVVTLKDMQQLEDKMYGPLIADFNKNAPSTMTVPDDVVYKASANLSMKRWTEVIKNEGVEVIGQMEFRTWNLPFFSTFVDLLVRHGELEMYALVSWCTVAALFANAELIMNFYGHPRRAAILHSAFCLSRAYIAAGKVLLRNYAREVLPLMARPQAETIALKVQAAFFERLSAWADYNANVSIMKYDNCRSWDNISLSFSVFDPVPKVEFTDIIVGEMGDSFLQNWRNAWMSRTHYRGFDIKIAITAIETLAFSADIEYRKGYILLPYVFSFPYYDRNSMPSINYGGFGAQVAFAVGQRFHSTYLSEDAGGDSFNSFMSCISNLSLSAQHKDAASLFAEVVSLGAVVDTYRNASDGRRLVLMERMTGEQLLFVAICYSQCIGSYYVVDDSMCDAVLQNVPEFSKAYSCAPGTPMNPYNQCRLF